MASRSTGAECAFSPNGQYFAHISGDGRLKIWECDSARPKQEFLPSAHLSAACTCLVWAPLKQAEQGLNRKKKKRKATGEEKQNSESVAGSDIIALGTASGTILLYSLNRAELVHQLNGGHSEKIHSLCWNENGSSLFSVSSDRKIIEWDIVKGVVKSQWKCDKGPVYRLCMLPDDKTLVTGGRSIYCWNIETRKVVATFSGHSSNVVNLMPVHLPGNKGGYFLSAAEGDRSICAWRYVEKESNNRCLATFILQDEPACFTISRPASDKDPLVLGAVSLSGILHVYEHHLNGWIKKPLEPKVKVHIGCDSSGSAKPLPILAAYACSDVDGHCVIVYGSLIKPAIEKICYRSQESQTYLIRKDPLAVDQKSETIPAMKTRTPVVPSDVKTLAPEYMLPTNVAGDTGRKRRNANSESNAGPTKDSLPMEQRLSALNLDKTLDAVAPPQADNMAQLLLQGLQSRDPKILQGVLDRGDGQIITNTVRRLPVQAVLPLLHELTRFMQFKGHPNHSYAKWLQSILGHHAGYLTSCPDLSSALTPLLAINTARTRLSPKVSQLKGRLNLILGELEHRSEKKDSSPTAELPATALLVYREESSDEASEDGDWPLQSGSESDDQWDEFSDNGEAMDVTDINDTLKEDSDVGEEISDEESDEIEGNEELDEEDEEDEEDEDEEDDSNDLDSDDDRKSPRNSFLDDEAEEDFNAFVDEGEEEEEDDEDEGSIDLDEDSAMENGISD